VRASITTRFEMNRTINPASVNGKNRVTGFVRAFVDLKPLATECEHLGHERHAVETSIAVESAEDFAFAANFHPVAYSQSGGLRFHIRTKVRTCGLLQDLTFSSRDHETVLTEAYLFLQAPEDGCNPRAQGLIQSR
jgi:hypothetical protein